ncbi:MAG: FtsX-like permease family protein, partial [Bacteroidales bacterium]
SYAEFSVDPVSDIYMMPIPELQEASKSTTYTLLSIGVLILLIALFNLLNLQISLTPTRMHLFNTRRVLGLTKATLRLIIVSESVLFVFISILISLFFVNIFGKTTLVQMFNAPITIGYNAAVILTIGGVSLFLAALIGLYPAFYATSYPIATVLKGSFAVSPQGLRLRRVLLVAQFTISIGVLVIGGLIKSQHRYMQTRAWGIQTDEIVYLKGKFRDSTIFYNASNALVNELKSNPNIKACTFTRFLPGKVFMGWGRDMEGKQVQFKAWPVSHNFIEFFGLKLEEGESFTGYNVPGKGTIIVNQSFVQLYNIPDIIGKNIETFGGNGDAKVRGVVKDFNFNKLIMPIEPLALVCSDDQYCEYILIKLSGNDIPGTFDHIRKVWKSHNQPESDIMFLNDTLQNYYDKEANLSKIIFILSVISLIISIMGVYGLILFSTRLKMSEVAIRRINGATVGSIIWLLQKGYLVPIAVSSIIACPV